MVETSSHQSNLWTAAGEGDLDRVKHLVEVENLSPNAKDQNGYTAIHAAVSWGHPTLLRYLLSKGGNINITDSDGDTPLFTVESLEICKLVLELGGNPQIQNSSGETAATSLQEEHPEISQFLSTLTGESLPPPPISDEPVAGSAPVPTAEELQEQYTNVQPPTDVDSLDAMSRAAAVQTNNRAGSLLARVQAILAETDQTGEDPEPRIREVVDDAVRSTMRAGQDLAEMQVEQEEGQMRGQEEQSMDTAEGAGEKRQRTDDNAGP